MLGETQDLKTSKRLIGRYKSEEELRDIFEADKLRKPARRKLLVFRIVDVNDSNAWFLVSFDIKEVVGKKTGIPRKATKEYTIIKEYALLNCLCGWIDNSTYICPEPSLADFVRKYTEYVEVYPVVPYDDKTVKTVKEYLKKTIDYVVTKLLSYLQRKVSMRGGKRREYVKLEHGRARAKVKEILKNLELTLKLTGDKVVKYVDLTPLLAAKNTLESKLREYEERTIK